MEFNNLSNTPEPPYFAVIFTSKRTNVVEGYDEMNDRLFAVIEENEGFLGAEFLRDEAGWGINVSYWKDLESARAWKLQDDHLQAQQQGRTKWYSEYKVRISKVERDYQFRE